MRGKDAELRGKPRESFTDHREDIRLSVPGDRKRIGGCSSVNIAARTSVLSLYASDSVVRTLVDGRCSVCSKSASERRHRMVNSSLNLEKLWWPDRAPFSQFVESSK